MRAVAYCRVSTKTDEQLDSLESQQKFFAEYAVRNNYELLHIYADEGKSGTKMKNRTQLLQMLKDADNGRFDVVLIKDISRLARNTVDFLTSIRKLKALNIRVIFVNYDQTSYDSSEFMLTMLSAIAQEESANTSKRVRFGKKQNARHGKVPNLIFGYDKTIGDYFNLTINQREAELIRLIFKLYTEKHLGAASIADTLNKEGHTTKRGCSWTQNAVCRILSNEIYIGKVVNGKQEIEDFLTGKRKELKEDSWMVVSRPEFRIIEDETFLKAEEIRKKRRSQLPDNFKVKSGKYGLSGLIICKQCGSYYRRLVRTYKNTSVKWVCNGRNSRGTKFCSNRNVLDEAEFLEAINEYFISIIKDKNLIMECAAKEYKRRAGDGIDDRSKDIDFTVRLSILKKEKDKYIEMYTNDIITIDELKSRTECIKAEITNCKMERDVIQAGYKNYFSASKNSDILPSLEEFTLYLISSENILDQLIQKIVINDEGTINVYIQKFYEK
jgi:site-specific DNA recombinase